MLLVSLSNSCFYVIYHLLFSMWAIADLWYFLTPTEYNEVCNSFWWTFYPVWCYLDVSVFLSLLSNLFHYWAIQKLWNLYDRESGKDILTFVRTTSKNIFTSIWCSKQTNHIENWYARSYIIIFCNQISTEPIFN